ncbi:hypothetical protein KY342_06790 [Candidatus Woesearchaeota archaeon]|nr:hypothetical protein [Candidatus Woesearchaeota archaeon]
MDLELKIANFTENSQVEEEEFGVWKFVLVQDNSKILLYTGAQPKEDYEYGHSRVVSENDISEDIIGGGDMCFHYGTLDVKGMSGYFGIIPNSIMEQFAKLIFEQFQNKHKLKKIEINMHYIPRESEEADPEHIEMWKKLGYEFDNRKRVLEF